MDNEEMQSSLFRHREDIVKMQALRSVDCEHGTWSFSLMPVCPGSTGIASSKCLSLGECIPVNAPLWMETHSSRNVISFTKSSPLQQGLTESYSDILPYRSDNYKLEEGVWDSFTCSRYLSTQDQDWILKMHGCPEIDDMDMDSLKDNSFWNNLHSGSCAAASNKEITDFTGPSGFT